MPYATIDDVVGRYKPIIDLIGSGNLQVSSTDVASIYIADNESLIDAFLGVKYVTPITPVVPLITQLASDLSIHEILAEKLTQVPEFMDKRRNRCMDILAKLRDGHMVLSSATIISSHGDNFAWSTTQGYHSIFSPVLPATEQVPDSTRVDADEAARSGDIPPLDDPEFLWPT